MNATIEDYNGHAYTVIPFYAAGKYRVHYCGAYAHDFDTWVRVKELEPKETSLIAWDDLKAYVDRIDEKASERNAST